jgi:hypothetical protein
MQYGNNAYEKAKHDFYVEPAWIVEALYDAEGFAGDVWDPACGICTIPGLFNENRHEVYASDLVYRGHHLSCPHSVDFLESCCPSGTVDNIVCNPPYELAVPFTHKALGIAKSKVAMLVNSDFLYSQDRYSFFTETRPYCVYYSSRRPSMPPGEMLLSGEVKASNGKRNYCWVVWHVGYRGETFSRWL